MRGICVSRGCKNDKAKKLILCHKHKHRRFKQINPLSYFYSVLKQNAKRINKDFDLTIDEFKDFCKETNYIEKKGINKNALTIDRINQKRGYSFDNIQVLPNTVNRQKYVDEKILEYENGNGERKRIRQFRQKKNLQKKCCLI